MYTYFFIPLPRESLPVIFYYSNLSRPRAANVLLGVAHAESACVTVAAAVGGGKRTAANVVFAALGWWSTMASLPLSSWLSVTGDICVAETSRFEASRVIFFSLRFFSSTKKSVTEPLWLGTGTDGIKGSKYHTETANHAAISKRASTARQALWC